MTEWEATEIPASRETRLVLSRMSPVSLEKAGGETVSRLALIACFGSEVSNATRLPVPFQVSFSSSRATLQHRPTRSTGASFEENQPPLLSEAMTPSNDAPPSNNNHRSKNAVPVFIINVTSPTAQTNNSGGDTQVPGLISVGVTSDGVNIEQLAMRSMEETGAASVTVGLCYQESGVKYPTRVTAVIECGGSIRVIDRFSGRVG
ncbi:hypothetical protein QL093DRAFT_2101675 [Fusarium oxysporum]|nr:hypothetical protein QL093DRAFT_2101675 [Fusarium oxysporum]